MGDTSPEPKRAPAFTAVDAFWRAANYVTVAQLYLRDNVQLRRPLRRGDVKPVVLGHWGVAPALNFAYSHLGYAAKILEQRVGLVVGPAHAAAALFADLFLDGTLATEFDEFSPSPTGLESLVNSFGHRGRFQTEIGPFIPGVIYQGGELGHSLAVAQGAAFDRPGTVVACFIGDGEAETGGVSAAWQGGKYLHPATSGAVLPILNLNGYRMGSPSVLATMRDSEIAAFLEGSGYTPFFVGTEHEDMHRALIASFKILDAYRESYPDERQPFDKPWPAIVLHTPKGWTGPGEGSASSHKVPIRNAHKSMESLQALETWLLSYGPHECFDSNGEIDSEILHCLPMPSQRVGRFFIEREIACPRRLALPGPNPHALSTVGASHVPTVPTANFLAEVLREDHGRNDFRLFSPDELQSNRFESVLEASPRTAMRSFPSSAGSPAGRVMEVLNEPLCFGWLLGYVLTGRHGVLITYEAFAPILSSMALQYLRFVKQREGAKWSHPTSSVNILMTSLCWRNCYTHQNPDFIGLPFAKGFDAFEVYAPCDGNSLLASICRGMARPNALNIYVTSKTELNVVADFNQSVQDVDRGYSVVHGSEDDAPDLVLAVCGDFLLPEAQAAVHLAKAMEPRIGVRLVYFSRLRLLGGGGESRGQLDDRQFLRLFTATRPVLFLFCGFAVHLKGLLFDRPTPDRFLVRGYQDVGLDESAQLQASLGMDRSGIVSDLLSLASKSAGAHPGSGETA